MLRDYLKHLTDECYCFLNELDNLLEETKGGIENIKLEVVEKVFRVSDAFERLNNCVEENFSKLRISKKWLEDVASEIYRLDDKFWDFFGEHGCVFQIGFTVLSALRELKGWKRYVSEDVQEKICDSLYDKLIKAEHKCMTCTLSLLNMKLLSDFKNLGETIHKKPDNKVDEKIKSLLSFSVSNILKEEEKRPKDKRPPFYICFIILILLLGSLLGLGIICFRILFVKKRLILKGTKNRLEKKIENFKDI